MTKWLFLAGAIASEVSGTTFMKLSRGFEKPLWAAGALVCYAGTMVFLTLALKRLEMGTVYALWSGFGIALTTAIGSLAFAESITVQKIAGALLIGAGAVILNAGRAGA